MSDVIPTDRRFKDIPMIEAPGNEPYRYEQRTPLPGAGSGMHIALDYDDTYTRDPQVWDAFIELMRSRGHKVSIVTYRDDRHDRNDHLETLQATGTDVHYTRGVAKGWWCKQFGPAIDVWVDDRPKSIVENSALSPEQLAAWRENDKASRRVRA